MSADNAALKEREHRRSARGQYMTKTNIFAAMRRREHAATGMGLGRVDAGEAQFSRDALVSPRAVLVTIGVNMEDVNNYVQDVKAEAEQSKKTLEGLANDIRRLADIIIPALKDQTEKLRLSRMAAISEVQLSLKALGDVRKFFLEDTYEVEVQRMERLVRLCREIKELKDSGLFDAVCDSALKMAVK